ncbi:MAG: histidine--tRNA ligase [Nanoarchaeota archaeon]|nr:histidine--tRNA ligase [Nanoarchaeota archaeon]
MTEEKVKGFRDFYPEDKRTSNYIFSIWKNIAELYGYEEIDLPILELTKLYNKSGDEIPTQIYRFKDKKDRDLALRPETTPSVARMVRSKPDLKKPLKWYSISQCYRYERLQKGRSREFYQYNLDYIGSKSMQVDAEVITTLIKILNSCGLTEKDFYIRISNRRLINDLFKDLKITNVKEMARLLDKRCKLTDKTLKQGLKDLELNEKQITSVLKLLKTDSLSKIEIKSEGLEELKELFSIFKKYKVEKYIKLDLSIMRGFDYYTSTVFEAFDKEGDFRAIAGGGRYDDLAGTPGIGYGFGDIVLETFLKEKNKLPSQANTTNLFIIPIDNLEKCIPIAEQLRQEGINVSVDLQEKGISKNLDYADKQSIPYVLIVGENELSKNKVKFKNMTSGEEKLISVDKVIKEIE